MNSKEERLYTLDEVLEVVRQVLFYGTPEVYDNGGMYGNVKPTDTRKRAKDAFEKYYQSKNK